jgi:molecular chaperone DnaK (HSP70)
VGELAKLLPSNEKNIIYNIKRLLGKSIDDEEIKNMQKLPFIIKKDNSFKLIFKIKFLKNKFE